MIGNFFSTVNSSITNAYRVAYSSNNSETESTITPSQNETAGKIKECNICLTQDERKIYVTNCKHIFHYQCLGIWVHGYNNSKCPVCRTDLLKRDIDNVALSLEIELFSLVRLILNFDSYKAISDGSLEKAASLLEKNLTLTQDQLNSLMHWVLVHINTFYSPKILAILNKMGVKAVTEDLNNAVELSFDSNDFVVKTRIEILYKLGAKINKRQLRAKFFSSLSGNKIADLAFVKLFFEFDGFLDQDQLNIALNRAVYNGTIVGYEIAEYLYEKGARLTHSQLESALTFAITLPSCTQLQIAVSFLKDLGGKINAQKLHDTVLSIITEFDYVDMGQHRLALLFYWGAKLTKSELSTAMRFVAKRICNDTNHVLTVLYMQGGRLNKNELHDAMLLSLSEYRVYTSCLLYTLYNMGGCLSSYELREAICTAFESTNIHAEKVLVALLEMISCLKKYDFDYVTSVANQKNNVFYLQLLNKYSLALRDKFPMSCIVA